MRLIRGLWFIHGTRAAGSPLVSQPVEYDNAATEAPQLGEAGIVARAILRRLPGTRAPWESRAPFEASDAPVWGEP